jgi:hypothetical protein
MCGWFRRVVTCHNLAHFSILPPSVYLRPMAQVQMHQIVKRMSRLAPRDKCRAALPQHVVASAPVLPVTPVTPSASPFVTRLHTSSVSASLPVWSGPALTSAVTARGLSLRARAPLCVSNRMCAFEWCE